MTESTNNPESTNNLLPMRFDNKEIDIKNPWSDDALERKKIACVLTRRIENGASPYTISISGGWGTGKTFMLQRWQQQLKIEDKENKENKKYKAIYYNAWEDDFCENPLVSIIGQIAEEIKDNSLKGLIDDVKEIAKPLLIKKILGYAHLTKEELHGTIDNTIDEYSAQIATTKELKKSLTKLTAKIEEETGHPLIFIIDELDRCRPTFAIEILERIKHLFNIPGIIFVLGMNRAELEKSIKHVYGDINSEEYLRRFYDIDLTLSAPKSFDYCLHLINTNENILKDLIPNRELEVAYAKTLMDFYPYLFHYLKLSLRDTEHCFRVLYFILGQNYNEAGRAAMYLIVLRIHKPELYQRFIQEEASCEDVINHICSNIPHIDTYTTALVNNIAKEIYALANDATWDSIVNNTNTYFQFPILGNLPKIDERIITQIRNQGAPFFDRHYGNQALRQIASLLDLVDY